MKIEPWMVREIGQPMGLMECEEAPARKQVLSEGADCGACRTDLGFFHDSVPVRYNFPLTLGREISGRVIEADEAPEAWGGRDIVVPGGIPCGEFGARLYGEGPTCPTPPFPGSDVHGVFGTRVCAPTEGLCVVPALKIDGAFVANSKVETDHWILEGNHVSEEQQ